MAATIPALLKQCLKELTDITCSSELQRYESEVSHRSWLDELGRLRIWAGNIGAHQTGQSSLEYRLRDASHLKNETIKILQRMLQGLESISDLLNEPEEEVEDDPYEEAFSSDESEAPDDPEDDMTYAQVLHQSLRNTINLLFQMSMEIRRPADHDRLLGTKIKDDLIASFELQSHRHVSEKFPEADSEVTGRLGAAMAQQKAVLKYREKHRKKLAHGLIEDSGFSEISETIATDLPVPCEEDELGFLETSSISALTQTSYAPSMLAGGESLSVPKPPPESANESPFECPYCCLIVTIKSMKDWARHIFRDLMPYVCLASDCGTPSKLYESRRQWFHHMLSHHSASAPSTNQLDFVCPLCCGNFQPPITFERHVGHHLEQLALFILPRDYTEEEDSPDGSDAVAPSILATDLSDDDDASESIDEHESMPDSPLDTSSVHAENSNLDGLGDATPEPLHQKTELDPSSLLSNSPLSSKTKQWVEAKQYSYDGGTWGDEDYGEEVAALSHAFSGRVKQDAYKTREEAIREASKAESNAVIKFKDAVGRRFTFPFHLCATWQGMEDLIKNAFLHIEVLGPAVAEGHYDLVGPNGGTILPQVWEKVIEPGWTVTMHMWPLPEKLPENIKGTEDGSSNSPSRSFNTLSNHPQTSLTEHLDVEGVPKGQESSMQYYLQNLALVSLDHGHGASPGMATKKTDLDELLHRPSELPGPDEEIGLNAHQPASQNHETPFGGPSQSQVSPHSPQNQTMEAPLDVRARGEADHNVTHAPHGKKFRCRVSGCPQERVFTLRVTFARHIETQHFPRMTYHCPADPSCTMQYKRRDKLVTHMRAAHLLDPSTIDIDGYGTAIVCPVECHICHSSVNGWPEFYKCFMGHCEVDNEPETLDEAGTIDQEPMRIDQQEEAPTESLISKKTSNSDLVRTRRELNTAAAQKSREQKQAQAQASEDRIKELEEQIARLNQRQAQHQATQPASSNPRIQCKVPGCPSSDKIYQSRSSFQRHVESRHHPQARWFCSFEGCQREENSLEEVRFHCETKHSLEPAGEVRKIDLECPSVCSLCSSPVADWSAFYRCFISHCVSQEAELGPAWEAEGAGSWKGLGSWVSGS